MGCVCPDVEPGFGLALATTEDGVHWEKPSLGVVEWKGSKDNNLVSWGQRGGAVIHDPKADPEYRYAYISSDPILGTQLFASPDGVHFTMQRRQMPSPHFDSQISTFWDNERERYFHYPRVMHNGARAVGFFTTRTIDEPWPDEIPVVMSRDDADPPGLDLYTNACEKYETAYLGFPTPYYHYNEPAERAHLNVPALTRGGMSDDGAIDTQLATSRDGRSWTRYRTPYIATGQYDGLNVRVAIMIPGIIHEEHGLAQYFVGHTFTHGDTQARYGEGGRQLGGIFRVEQRYDGFISLDFEYEGGTVITAPLTFQGDRLSLNINTSASGEARVAILDAAGNEIPGYGLADARHINGDGRMVSAEWRDGDSDVGDLAGKPVRLRFECRSTKLYSFVFWHIDSLMQSSIGF